MITQPSNYDSIPVATIQCPRCGVVRDVRLVGRVSGALEYSGVCSTPVTGGGLCSTSLRLFASSHVFAN